MLREYEIQGSISEGVARVLRGEVAMGMDTLRQGRAKAVKFDVPLEKKDDVTPEIPKINEKVQKQEQEQEDTKATTALEPGHCIQCRKPFELGGKLVSCLFLRSLNTSRKGYPYWLCMRPCPSLRLHHFNY